jgi:hypothetical protein
MYRMSEKTLLYSVVTANEDIALTAAIKREDFISHRRINSGVIKSGCAIRCAYHSVTYEKAALTALLE